MHTLRRDGTISGPVTSVAIAPTPTGNGYWILDENGGVFGFGDAHFHGSAVQGSRSSRLVDIAATPEGEGYWLLTETGGVARFGDARHFGDR